MTLPRQRCFQLAIFVLALTIIGTGCGDDGPSANISHGDHSPGNRDSLVVPVPALAGMCEDDAIEVGADRDLRVMADSGSGLVVDQAPKPGTMTVRGERIQIILEQRATVC